MCGGSSHSYSLPPPFKVLQIWKAYPDRFPGLGEMPTTANHTCMVSLIRGQHVSLGRPPVWIPTSEKPPCGALIWPFMKLMLVPILQARTAAVTTEDTKAGVRWNPFPPLYLSSFFSAINLWICCTHSPCLLAWIVPQPRSVLPSQRAVCSMVVGVLQTRILEIG